VLENDTEDLVATHEFVQLLLSKKCHHQHCKVESFESPKALGIEAWREGERGREGWREREGGRGREGGKEGGREGGRKKRREGWREEGRKGGRDGGRKGGMEGEGGTEGEGGRVRDGGRGREGGREREGWREREREGEREGGMEEGRESNDHYMMYTCSYLIHPPLLGPHFRENHSIHNSWALLHSRIEIMQVALHCTLLTQERSIVVGSTGEGEVCIRNRVTLAVR